MRNDPERLRLLREFSCACPLGIWPRCGVDRTCGEWERRARLRGISITTIDGLTKPFVMTLAGSSPALLLPAWVVGTVREYVICWALCEIVRGTLGDDSVDERIAVAVARVEAS